MTEDQLQHAKQLAGWTQEAVDDLVAEVRRLRVGIEAHRSDAENDDHYHERDVVLHALLDEVHRPLQQE